MSSMQVLGDVQTTYRNFAVYAADNSPCFEEWALGVAEDREVQRWLVQLPETLRLGVDGHAVGHTHQHGRSLHWWG